MTSSARTLRPETTLITAGRGGDPAQPINLPIVPMSNFRSGHTADALATLEAERRPVIGEVPVDYRREQGGGNGLALHSTMMAVVGGTLAVESEVGSYTRVILTLPPDG